MADEIVQNFDYDPENMPPIDYEKQFMDFLTGWCAMCQNREPMTRADVAANEFGIEMQEWVERMAADE